MIAIKTFLQDNMMKLIIGGLSIVAVMFAVHFIKESGRTDEKLIVAEQSIKDTNTHIQIEEGQSEIRNHSISDADLFDSLYNGSF